MKFLLDEDVPLELLKILQKSGHDIIRVTPSSPDPEIAERAKKEKRILITLDKDFTNRAQFPPKEYDVVQFRIHPPYAERLIEAMDELLRSLSPEEWKGLIVVQEGGHIRVPE